MQIGGIGPRARARMQGLEPAPPTQEPKMSATRSILRLLPALAAATAAALLPWGEWIANAAAALDSRWHLLTVTLTRLIVGIVPGVLP